MGVINAPPLVRPNASFSVGEINGAEGLLHKVVMGLVEPIRSADTMKTSS
jgi:hypothetical protein